MDYKEFILSKQQKPSNYGIEPNYINPNLFDFQSYIIELAVKKGRCGVFLDTGLGKTLIQLTIAQNYYNYTKKRVLIITPLAVAFQFIDEASKFGFKSVSYSKQGKLESDIVVCNYERLSHFKPSDFGCVLLDESSILKNFNGAIKHSITTFLKDIKYRFLFTATPSPNDYIELGTSSEALGYLGYLDMLGKYFANNENNIRPQDIGSKFYLKPHAEQDFFIWVSSWAISARKPSDLGFSDDKYKLPKLITNQHFVKNDENWIVDGQPLLFGKIAKRMSEVREEQKMTINNRVNKAVELTKDKEFSVYWCNFNDESSLIKELDKDSYELKGSMKLEHKEEILHSFYKKEIKKIITKPKITAFGLNWQHCNHSVIFPTWSYEQYYQAIRRFWRFGQKRDVTIDLVLSDGQKRVIDTLLYKSKRADDLFTKLKNKMIDSQYHIRELPQINKLPNWS